MSGRYENVDGHRMWVEVDAPSSEVSADSTPPLISTSEGGSFPPFAPAPDYRTGMVALLVDLEHVAALVALFPDRAAELHGAAQDVEEQIEADILRARDRQIRGCA